MAMRPPSSQLVWHPFARQDALRTLFRMSSTVRLQTDFGAAVPSQRPKPNIKNLLYVTEPTARKGSFGRFLRAAKGQTPYILGAVGGVCIYSAATLAIPAGFGALIDLASKGEMPVNASVKLLGWLGMCALGNYLRLACIGYAGETIIAKLRRQLYAAIIKQPAAFFDSPDNRTGSLVQRVSMDCNVVGSSLTEAVTSGTKNLLQTVGSIGVMLYFSPVLTSVIIGLIPPVSIFAGVYGRYVRKLQHNMQDAIADMGTVAEERLSNIRTVKAFGTSTQEEWWFSKKVDRVFDLSMVMLRWNAAYVASLQTVGYGAMYCVIWAGSMLVASGGLTPGTLFSFMLYTVYCGMGLTGLTNLATEINKGYGASLRLFDIIDRAEAITAVEEAKTKVIPEKCGWGIQFRDVNFAYPTRPEAPIYTSLNMDLRPACCTCIVGSSGSGKSSLAHLLLKLYDVDAGTITIDGHNLEDIDAQWLRKNIGYVSQEPMLLGGSIAQNIAYGLPDRNWDDPIDRWLYSSIVEAARRANAHDFITSLPDGYDTFVGESGRSLSGGQKQRIAIARALIRSPPFTILDEATSALDSESEVVVHEAIFRLIEEARESKGGQPRTVLLFAHKLSMIKRADRILVLDQGRVVADGTFDDVSKNDLFCQLTGVAKTA